MSDILWADKHIIFTCGAHTGHYVKQIAFCMDASTAETLVDAHNSALSHDSEAERIEALKAQNEWLKSRIAETTLPTSKRDHDSREKYLLHIGMPSLEAGR